MAMNFLSEKRVQRVYGKIIAGLIALVVIRAWAMPLPSSFWLDETGTYHVISVPWAEMAARLEIWAQPRLYCALLWGLFQMGARNELWLRLPSLISMLGALWLLYWLARRLFHWEVALAACLVFACLRDVIGAAADARPYGLATFFTLAAMVALILWLDHDKSWLGISYAVLAATTLHLHYFFGLTFLIHLAWFLLRYRRLKVLPRHSLWIALLLIALTIPVIPALRVAMATTGLYTHRDRPGYAQLAETLLPATLLWSFLLGCTLAWFVERKFGLHGTVYDAADVRRVLIWALIPPVVLFGAARVTGIAFFEPRYCLAAAPALAILAALALATLNSVRVRMLILVLLVVLQLKNQTGVHAFWPHHTTENWRAAMTAVTQISSAGTTVLVRSGYPEAGSRQWLGDERRRGMVLAPVSAYSIPGRVIPAPYRMDLDAEEYLDTLVDQQLIGLHRFVFVTREGGAPPIRAWLQGRLHPYGFAWRSLGNFGDVEVDVVERLDRQESANAALQR